MAAHVDITDGNGYAVRQEDLEFLKLPPESLTWLKERKAPLGMNQEDYSYTQRALTIALKREGITEAAVRLQGSSAHFFSSWHKRMPFSLEEIAELVLKDTDQLNEAFVYNPILDLLERQWPHALPRPTRRPFDALYRVKLVEQSDYDLQISSDQMMERIYEDVKEYGYNPEKITATHAGYGFVLKNIAEKAFPHVSTACTRIANRTNRSTTWALFAGCGPSKYDVDERLSSHHKDSDWMILDLPSTPSADRRS